MTTRWLMLLAGLILLFPLTGCNTPLGDAALYGDTKRAQTLLEQGADPEETVAFMMEWRPLHYAVTKGHLDTVRVLLDKGADINSRAYNCTALHYAAAYGQASIAKLLLDRGAQASLVANSGQCGAGTALQLAEQRGHFIIAKWLREAEARELGLPQVADVKPPSAMIPAPAVTGSSIDVDQVPVISPTKKKNAYAVVIGIEQYREKLPKADYADRDAKLVGEYLTKVMGYPEENVIVRINDRATRTDLVKYFEEWLRNNVEKDGSVFIYYSGHGAPNTKTGEAYFVPYDGDPSFVESTAYPVKQLYSALEKLPAKDITVVLDSCFSGAGGRSVLAKGARPMGLSIENATLATGRTVVLAASGGDQISNSFEEKGHGLMTYFFLKGLQGEGDTNHDGVIELAELFEYVKPNVQRIARKQYNNEQTPQLLAGPEAMKHGAGRLVGGARQ